MKKNMPGMMMNIDIDILRTKLEHKKGVRDDLTRRHQETIQKLNKAKKELQDSEEAQTVIREEARKTQGELEIHISEMVSQGLAAIFDDPYTFRLEFVLRRDKTEADLIWEKGKYQFLPNGGGVRDISALSLRLAILRLPTQPGGSILLLDEPAKHVSAKYLNRLSQLFTDISKEMGIQIIMISHTNKIIGIAQDSFEIGKENDISEVFPIKPL